jgi:hypothetical protein
VCQSGVKIQTETLPKNLFISALRQLLAPRTQVASAPPCGTGLSATLKPRFAGLHPSGFNP